MGDRNSGRIFSKYKISYTTLYFANMRDLHMTQVKRMDDDSSSEYSYTSSTISENTNETNINEKLQEAKAKRVHYIDESKEIRHNIRNTNKHIDKLLEQKQTLLIDELRKEYREGIAEKQSNIQECFRRHNSIRRTGNSENLSDTNVFKKIQSNETNNEYVGAQTEEMRYRSNFLTHYLRPSFTPGNLEGIHEAHEEQNRLHKDLNFLHEKIKNLFSKERKLRALNEEARASTSQNNVNSNSLLDDYADPSQEFGDFTSGDD
jgi:hypothetical protein